MAYFHLNLRLQHLKDHIKKDLALIEEYQRILFVVKDPLLRCKYNQKIKELKKTLDEYKKEYKDLKNRINQSE